MTTAKTTQDLIRDINRICFFPEASDISDDDKLNFADEEMNTLMALTLKSTHDEWWVRSVDIPMVSGVTLYRLPQRILGRTIRAVFVVWPNGMLQPLDQIDLVSMKARYAMRQNGYVPGWFAFMADQIEVGSSPGPTYSLRIFYELSPSKLIQMDQAYSIESASSSTSMVISGSNISVSAGDVFDIVSGRDPHDVVGYQLLVTNYDAGTRTVTFDSSTPYDTTMVYTSQLQTGGNPDYLCPQGTTVYPQIPKVLWLSLVRGAARSLLDSIADPKSVRMAQLATEARTAAMAIIAPRDQRRSETIVGMTPLRLGDMRLRRGGGFYNW